MTQRYADRVLESTTTTGTGAITLAGAVTGFQTFASICGVGDTCFYSLWCVDGIGSPVGAWETGLGTFGAGDILTRTRVLASSAAGAPITLVGTSLVALSVIASQTPQINPDGSLNIPGSGGGSTNFLRADGVWAQPPGLVAFLEEGGADGDQGPPGSAGAAGAAGATGASGPAGPAVFLDAEAGDTGDQGPPGPIGATGPTGAQGQTGAQGPTGAATYLEAEAGDVGDPGPPVPLSGVIGRLIRAPQTLTTGTTTYTPPPGCTAILVQLVGGGGAGGGGSNLASDSAAGSGGGAGSYAEKYFAVDAGTVYTIAIGAGGTAGTAGNNAGNNGGNTTITVGGVTVTAFGGTGGGGMGAGTTALWVLGGAGGAISTNGDLNTVGAPGDASVRASGTICRSGSGGNSVLSGGARGLIAQGTGVTATGFGGGGSGGVAIGVTAASAGGAGAPGCIVVSEYY